MAKHKPTLLDAPDHFNAAVERCVHAFLRKCVDDGMALPLIVLSACPNGSVSCMRTDGVKNEILAANEDLSQSWPMALLVLDQQGQTATHTVGVEDVVQRLEEIGAKGVQMH